MIRRTGALRLRAAALLRRLAARLDGAACDCLNPHCSHRRPHLSVVPSGYAAGRADLQLTHTPGGPLAFGHTGAAEMHSCRCDSWRLEPGFRGRAHPCRCPHPDDEGAHLPPGGPPFITADGPRS